MPRSRREALGWTAADRVQAASDRNEAADDRARAAINRSEAARGRADAERMLAESANTLKSLVTDELTGAWTRKLGLEAAARELERSHRNGEPLAVAFADVDGLKQINDTEGHPAGDVILELTGRTVLAHLRPYDIVVRYGGDELVCFMPNLHEHEAATRLRTVAAALVAVNPNHSVTFGVAEARPDDTLETLIGRADGDLLKARSLRVA